MRPFLIPGALLAAASAITLHAQETQRVYLSGHGKDDPLPWRFFCTTGSQSGYWTNLPVPSCWELYGFGTLSYHRDATNPPPEQGRYLLDFKASSKWENQRVFLVFEGVMTDATVSLNGKPAGPKHQGAYYRFKYEVTDLLQLNNYNRLEVTVDKKSANPSVNNAERKGDYWMFGGIFRPVYFEILPRQFIERVAINAQADGTFRADVFADHAKGTTVEAQFMTVAGKNVGSTFSAPLSENSATLQTKFRSPLTWTAETPNLYQVELRLKVGKRIVHQVRQRFGFRTMEVRDGDGLYVNGERVILQGCNRHSFWPDSGRCLSDAVHWLDVETMKAMNMNAVRMSHYPPDAGFLDLCDELGLYVLDELAGWHGNYDTETGRKRVEEMVTRDLNHPCVLFWDNGNEGGFNTNLDNLFLELDPQKRRVLHPWSPFSGVNTSHYLAYDKAAIACQGVATHYRSGQELVDTNDPSKYIYMPTEFIHGLFDGGAGAGLEDYWTLMRSSETLGGGFIWAFLDEGVKRPDTSQIDLAGNQAPDGIVGPYREREGSFYTVKELWSPIVVTRESATQFKIENRYSFTDANQCKFTWQLRKFPTPDEPARDFHILRDSKVKAPSIAAGSAGMLELPLPAMQGADALALRVDDPKGRELWTYVWPESGLQESLAQIESNGTGSVVRTSENAETVTVSTGDLAADFSKKTGLLASIRRGARAVSLRNGPALTTGPSQLVKLEHAMEGAEAVINATYTGDMKSIRWRVTPTGWVHCDYSYTAEGSKEYLGVTFDYPEQFVKAKKWLGQGPYRVWKNRLRGGVLNVWQNDYNNTITGWRDWVYPEFKGCFAGVRWMQLQTGEGTITVVPSENLFVQVLQPGQPPKELRGKTDFSLPAAGLSLLHAIPPIGSKFKPADQGGPQGELTKAHGEYHGSVAFYFGER